MRRFPTPAARFLTVFLASGMFLSLGCDSGPKVYPVKGKVVNKGKGHIKDLAGYNVQFQSDQRTGGDAGRADRGGRHVHAVHPRGRQGRPGVKEGTYRACLLPPPVEGGAPRLVIPQRYTKFETSNLEYTITPGPNDLTIEIDGGR